MMHPAERINEYCDAKHAVASLVPPMPDVFCRREDSVYSFQPLTANGRRFLATYDDLYQADEIRVSASSVMPLFDAMFDEGLSVV